MSHIIIKLRLFHEQLKVPCCSLSNRFLFHHLLRKKSNLMMHDKLQPSRKSNTVELYEINKCLLLLNSFLDDLFIFFQPDFCRCSLFQSIRTIRKCRFVGLDTIKQHVKKNVLQIFAPVSSVSNLCRSCHGTLTAIYYTKHYILIC